jgi:hypothetical protein
MIKKVSILTSLLALIFSSAVWAQDTTEAETEEAWRTYEVTASFGISMPSGPLKDWGDSLGAKTGINFGGSGGYYLNDKVCLGVYFSYVQFPMEIYDLHYNLYDVGGYAKYTFPGESNLEPYLKLKAGADFAKFPTWVGENRTRLREISYGASLTMGLYVGALYYTSDYGGIYLELGYNYAKLKDNEAEYMGEYYKLGDNGSHLDIRAGMTVFFGPE